MRPCRAPEFEIARLLLRKLSMELLHTLAETVEKVLGICLILATRHKVIGKPVQRRFTPAAPPHPALDPDISDVVEGDIGKERRAHSPYKVANFFFRGWTPQGVDRSERRHAPRWGPPPPASPGHGSVRVCVPSLPPLIHYVP